MKKPTIIAGLKRAAPALALLLCMGSANAQVYKWVDAKGAVHYSDKPPPADARASTVKPSSGAESASPLPFELAQAMRNHPVTLYTAAQCSACEQGRSYLQSRGIPYAEKTVLTAADEDKLRTVGSPGQVPLLLVGRSKSIGFETSAWAALLSDAGYPSKRMLPSTYQNPQASSAAPAPVQADATAAAPAPRAPRKRAPPPPPPAEPTAPPGFRF